MSIDFERQLNPAQLEAVMTTEGPVLVIAGAGSGKTRTIVHRLARLVEQGVDPTSILLLTFTRKAAMEMLSRAEKLLGMALGGVQGGTFHAFSFATLRRYPQALGMPGNLTIMDRADAEDVMHQVMGELALGKGDKSFPKKGTVLELYSKSRNKELSLHEVLSKESYQLLPHADAMDELSRAYQAYKENHCLLDYDDMLFTLERLLVEQPDLLEHLRARHRYIMVDEYQDTNMVQARLVRLLAGDRGNVMAVGDDAQSIYAFRGANVENILSFPRIYENTRLIRLEQNYRSTQPILNLTNAILRQAAEKFDKTLFSERTEGPLPEIIKAYSDRTQAQLVAARIREYKRIYMPGEIAVLFRAGYMSYPLELELNKAGIAFQKYGGLRFSDAAHVKDTVAHLRVVHNPLDAVAWRRCLTLVDKIGEKTANRIIAAVRDNDATYLGAQRKKNPYLHTLLEFLEDLRAEPGGPASMLERVISYYTPRLTQLHPEDYPRRLAGLEQLSQIATSYAHLEAFLADLALENPEEEQRGVRDDAVVLSTVHSSKGLEWAAVIVIDLVDERFPSRHALMRPEDLDEERRLLYVACTRAKDMLTLCVPGNVYNRASGTGQPAMPSLFVRELPGNLHLERRETYSGHLTDPIATEGSTVQASSPSSPSWAPSFRATASSRFSPPASPNTSPSRLFPASSSDGAPVGAFSQSSGLSASPSGMSPQSSSISASPSGVSPQSSSLSASPSGVPPHSSSLSASPSGMSPQSSSLSASPSGVTGGGAGIAGPQEACTAGGLPPRNCAAPRTADPCAPAAPSSSASSSFASPLASSGGSLGAMGFCRHRIFGRGKIVARLDGGKCRVNFPGFGLKVILSEYLEMES